MCRCTGQKWRKEPPCTTRPTRASPVSRRSTSSSSVAPFSSVGRTTSWRTTTHVETPAGPSASPSRGERRTTSCSGSLTLPTVESSFTHKPTPTLGGDRCGLFFSALACRLQSAKPVPKSNRICRCKWLARRLQDAKRLPRKTSHRITSAKRGLQHRNEQRRTSMRAAP